MEIEIEQFTDRGVTWWPVNQLKLCNFGTECADDVHICFDRLRNVTYDRPISKYLDSVTVVEMIDSLTLYR